jgi:hypothetical protein
MATRTETEPIPVGTVGDIAVFAESNSVTIQNYEGCEQVTVLLRDVRVLLAPVRAARDEAVQRQRRKQERLSAGRRPWNMEA